MHNCLHTHRISAVLVFLSALSGAGCSTRTDSLIRSAAGERDVHSFARPEEVVVTHLDLDLTVDFERRVLSGQATLQLHNKTGTGKLHLDTRDLTITRVTCDESAEAAAFTLGEPVPILGQPLIVEITPVTKSVTITYTTSPAAAALQWLGPEQTHSGTHPFLFTQSQSLLARTWIPCQDSPGVRMTYHARVHVPGGLMALMSAENDTARQPEGNYEFNMPHPVPSYLLALAVGDIDFRPLGPRSGVYAEPAIVDKAAWEFADTERMMAAAESLYGPYRWGRYDLIVLPPSFPYGGMENPCLTFATPTILAGDRSLVALVAHELAHSWSGNLVTNATWDDAWLNEGFTAYIENRIMEALYGKAYADMLAVLTLSDLRSEIERVGADSPDTHLHLNLAGRDPDEGITGIVYDKGSFLLRLLEERFGRERWDAFLRRYFDEFAFQSMTTARFLAYLRAHLLSGDRALEQHLQLHAWLYGPGLPDNIPVVHSTALQQVEEQAQSFLAGQPALQLQTANWATPHWLHFLRRLTEKMAQAQLADLEAAFRFSATGNAEILYEWLMHAITSQYEPAYPALESFLLRQGRLKFLRPLYTKLAETSAGLTLARSIYAPARPHYHAVAVGIIDRILGWNGAEAGVQ